MATLEVRKNAGDQCFIDSNVVNRVPRAGLEPTSENIGSDVHTGVGGNHGGNIEPIFDRVEVFCERLQAEGFTSDQVRMIDTALRESGLEIVVAERSIE